MEPEYYSAVFPIEDLKAHVRPEDLRAFKNIGLDRINGGSHLAQLRQGPRTVGLSSLQIYPQYEEVHVTYIEICSDVRGDKLGRKLLASIFDYAADMAKQSTEHIFISAGGFTAKGERSILPAMKELSIEYSSRGVTFDPPEHYR